MRDPSHKIQPDQNKSRQGELNTEANTKTQKLKSTPQYLYCISTGYHELRPQI